MSNEWFCGSLNVVLISQHFPTDSLSPEERNRCHIRPQTLLKSKLTAGLKRPIIM